MSLFELRLRERVELQVRIPLDYLTEMVLPPLVLQKGEKVQVLDVAGEKWLCDTRHGRVFLHHSKLRPGRGR